MGAPYLKITHLVNQGLFPTILTRGDLGDVLHTNRLVGLIGGGKLTVKGFVRNLSSNVDFPVAISGATYFSNSTGVFNRPWPIGLPRDKVGPGDWGYFAGQFDPLGVDIGGNLPWTCDVSVPGPTMNQFNHGIYIIGLQSWIPAAGVTAKQPGTPYDEIYFKALMGNFISPLDAKGIGAGLIALTGGGPLSGTGTGGGPNTNKLWITSVQAVGSTIRYYTGLAFKPAGQQNVILTPTTVVEMQGGGTLTVTGITNAGQGSNISGTGVTYYNDASNNVVNTDWNSGNLFGPATFDPAGADANGWTPWKLDMTVPNFSPDAHNRSVFAVAIQCSTNPTTLITPGSPYDTIYFKLNLGTYPSSVDDQGVGAGQAMFLPFGPQAANV